MTQDGFSVDWLSLREPADLAARAPDLRDLFAARVRAIPDAHVLDLGAGTGATYRALAPHLSASVSWRLADHDAALLAEASRRLPPHVATLRLDLNDIAALPLDAACLVTASALFDLCSRDFIDRFLARLRAAGVPGLYAALNYDGGMNWSVPHPLDDTVTAAFNRHQQGDKGFGRALGPHAGDALVRAAEAAGYHARIASSPWRLTPAHTALQIELLRGIAAAAGETGALAASGLADWHEFRRAHVADAVCLIGHGDVLAFADPAA